jgi:hypothetical protein
MRRILTLTIACLMLGGGSAHLTAVDTAGGITWAIAGTAHGVIVVRRC